MTAFVIENIFTRLSKVNEIVFFQLYLVFFPVLTNGDLINNE
jgi:hypothetical protein